MDNGLWNTLERLADGHPPAAVLAEWQRLADGEFAGVRPFLRLRTGWRVITRVSASRIADADTN